MDKTVGALVILMLAAVICCMSVLCTASLASFGMDMAAVVSTSSLQGSRISSSSSSSGSINEDVMRLSSGCLLFHEFFAAVAILVSIAYYAVVKASLLAMGAVIMKPPKPHPAYYSGDDNDLFSSSSSPSDGSASSSAPASSHSPSEDEQPQHEDGDNAQPAAAAPKQDTIIPMEEAPASNVTMCSTTSSTSSDDDDEHANLEEFEAQQPSAAAAAASTGSHNNTGNEHGIEVTEVVVDAASSPRRKKPSKNATTYVRLPPPLPQQSSSSSIPWPTKRSSHHNRERFSAVKIWTNIYGLSIGIYCLVYSLMLPNELSAFVFCVATLMASIYEWAVPCMRAHLHDHGRHHHHGRYNNLDHSYHNNSGGTRRVPPLPSSSSSAGGRCNNYYYHTRPRTSKTRCSVQCKRCLGLLCIVMQGSLAFLCACFPSSCFSSDAGMAGCDLFPGAGRSSSSSSRRRGGSVLSRGIGGSRSRGLRCCSLLQQCISSGALAIPALILMIALGLTLKVLEAVFWQDAINRNGALVSSSSAAAAAADQTNGSGGAGKGGVWASALYSPTLLGSLLHSSDRSKVDATNAIVNVLFPIVGVLALKSMRKASNIRETMELAVPVCALNSLCIVCIILMQNSICLSKHLSATITMADTTKSLVTSGSTYYNYQQHSNTSYLDADDKAVVRYQPILAALALPFPLVCSIVCIVAAGRNHRVMVSSICIMLLASSVCTAADEHAFLSQDVASSIFLAYAAKQFEGNRWYFSQSTTLPESTVTQESRFVIVHGFAPVFAQC